MVAGSDTLVDDWRGTDEADLGFDIVTVLCLGNYGEGLSLCLDLLFGGGLVFRIVGLVCPSCPSSVGASSTTSAFASISIAALWLFAILTFARSSVPSSASSSTIVPAPIG